MPLPHFLHNLFRENCEFWYLFNKEGDGFVIKTEPVTSTNNFFELCVFVYKRFLFHQLSVLHYKTNFLQNLNILQRVTIDSNDICKSIFTYFT